MNCLTRLIKYNISMRVKPHKPKQTPFDKWFIYKGDQVIMRNGKDKGKKGKIMQVFRKQNKTFKKEKYTFNNVDQKGVFKTLARSLPVHVSKVALLDPQQKIATKIFFAFDETTGKKIRISKKSNAVISRPILAQKSFEARTKGKGEGAYDTKPSKVLQITYTGEDFQSIKRQFEAQIAQKQRRQKLLVFKL